MITMAITIVERTITIERKIKKKRKAKNEAKEIKIDNFTRSDIFLLLFECTNNIFTICSTYGYITATGSRS